MATYRYVGPNDHYLDGGERVLTPGDEVELPEGEFGGFPEYFERVDSEESESASESDSEEGEDDSPSEDEESAENEAEPAQDEAESESAEAPFDPGEKTVSELEVELEQGDFSDAELEALKVAEADGADRTSAEDAIDDVLAA